MDEGVNQQERCLRPHLYKTPGLLPCGGEAWYIVTTQCAMPRHHKPHDRVSWRLKTLWQLDCLFYSLFKLPTDITSMFCVTGPLWGELIIGDSFHVLRDLTPSWSSQKWNFVCHPRDSININPSSSGQNGRRFADDIFKSIFMNEKSCTLIWISLDLFPKGTQLTITHHWFR